MKVFDSKCYILKESSKGKFDVKGDEGIFLGYSCKRKAYKCLNLSTHKIIESANVRIDDFAKKSEEERCKEPKDYRKFIYYEPNTLLDTSKGNKASPPESPKSPLATKLQLVQLESATESQSKAAKLTQTES